MKVGITYFWQIRNFKANQIPVSTALWDPAWYRSGGPRIDPRTGVLLGLRIPELNPDPESTECVGCSRSNPGSCEFLSRYRRKLRSLKWSKIIGKLETIGEAWKRAGGTGEPEIYLVVYETPSNPCSERVPLVEWFRENGYDLEEYR